MLFRRKRIWAAAMLAATAGGLGGIGPQAIAQEQAPQRVEITGSNIRRIDAESPSPVQVLSNADIEKSGKASVAELLQTLSADNQGSVPMTFGNGFAAGASGISLRGLGAASTLVLINGRRVAPYGLADDGQKVFVDLNIIPLEAVDRVEVLKDGASAIYGSDAIAGVVNVILKKQWQGTTLKATAGTSRYGDGTEAHAGIAHGFGDLENDKYNLLFNLEASHTGAIWNRDRAGRGAVGRTDLRDFGYDADAGLGGTGAIISGGSVAGSAVNGNVRNPDTGLYYNRGNTGADTGFTRTFPAAACSHFTDHPQGDPGGGCLTDATQQYGQIQPSQDSVNGFARASFQLRPNLLAYTELNLYHSESKSETTPSGVNASVGYPGGPVSNAGVSLGADHPDNPYFGQAARVRYLAADVGPRTSDITSDFVRFVAGLKGTAAGWDYDTGLLYSANKVGNTLGGYLQRDVAFALLNPTADNVAAATAHSPAYAALPAGTVWRIGENAGLNSPDLYAALSPSLSNDSKSQTAQVDFKASHDLAELAGGTLGMAVGGEFRHESIRLSPTTGTERGNIIGLGYSAYDGGRNLSAVYAELDAPVLATLEIDGAVRLDHYSDVGNSTTPKIGFKWTPVRQFALRGTYAEGFRAPSPAENGKGGLAAYSSATDPQRCGLGIAAACSAASVAVITSPNPDLKPEKSKNYTLGMVFEPVKGTNLSLDWWQIVRKDEINQQATADAIAAGQVVRDPSGATATPGDPGPLLAVLTNYINSNKSTVRGLDADVRQALKLGEAGRLALGLTWTHLYKWQREESDGTVMNYAGTHGNCDVTNCMGTPKDRGSFDATWERGDWRVAMAVDYRGPMSNKLSQEDADCAVSFADGSDAPAGCRIASFTTVDMTARWQAGKALELFGGIRNLFDRTPPLDPTTYGATSFNPLDYSGAVGRFYSLGAKYTF